MPLYEYRCTQCGASAEVRRPVDERDAPLRHAGCTVEEAPGLFTWAPMRRQFSHVQRPITRPLGYSLHPGDKGYYAVDWGEGRRERSGARGERLTPFALAEDYEKAPPKIAGDDEPVLLAPPPPPSRPPASVPAAGRITL